MKLNVLKGSTSFICHVFVADSTQTYPKGLTGLTNASAGLKCYYMRAGASADVSVTINSISAFGTFAGSATNSAFKEVDSTNMPGIYELQMPNNALATGANAVIVMLQGATNMVPLAVEIQLVSYDPNDATRLGLSALPAAPMAVKKNAALSNFMFPMFNLSGQVQSGLTVTAQRSIDGAAFASCANSVSAISNGWYKINLAATDLNGTVIALRFSASGNLDSTFTIVTQA